MLFVLLFFHDQKRNLKYIDQMYLLSIGIDADVSLKFLTTMLKNINNRLQQVIMSDSGAFLLL